MGERRVVDDILLCDRCVAGMEATEDEFTDFCERCVAKLHAMWNTFEKPEEGEENA